MLIPKPSFSKTIRILTSTRLSRYLAICYRNMKNIKNNKFMYVNRLLDPLKPFSDCTHVT